MRACTCACTFAPGHMRMCVRTCCACMRVQADKTFLLAAVLQALYFMGPRATSVHAFAHARTHTLTLAHALCLHAGHTAPAHPSQSTLVRTRTCALACALARLHRHAHTHTNACTCTHAPAPTPPGFLITPLRASATAIPRSLARPQSPPSYRLCLRLCRQISQRMS